MRHVMPRPVRPRFLLLPLVLGLAVIPAALTGSTTPGVADLRTAALCPNAPPRTKTATKPPAPPTCVNCRAPLINAPLARAERDALAGPAASAPAA
jgi:hypothetical protein